MRLRKLVAMLLILTMASAAFADLLFFLIKKQSWLDLPAGQKDAGYAILRNCSDAGNPLSWTFCLRKTSKTNEVWGWALYKDGAWALKRKQEISEADLTQIEAAWGCQVGWSTNMALTLIEKGLEKIPDPPAPTP
jgi:hypothetical protein